MPARYRTWPEVAKGVKGWWPPPAHEESWLRFGEGQRHRNKQPARPPCLTSDEPVPHVRRGLLAQAASGASAQSPQLTSDMLDASDMLDEKHVTGGRAARGGGDCERKVQKPLRLLCFGASWELRSYSMIDGQSRPTGSARELSSKLNNLEIQGTQVLGLTAFPASCLSGKWSRW